MNKIAVYGTLRKGNGNNMLLSTSNFLGATETLPKFEMFSLGGFPGIRNGSTRIKVEVYEVDEHTLGRLDRLEGYHGVGQPNLYERETIDTEFGDALVYTLKDDRYNKQDVISSGDWAMRNNQ
jgi:gamma-glutamylcyclotransferase (GGCT)/AIG2-like uncharacterized protein YtfP